MASWFKKKREAQTPPTYEEIDNGRPCCPHRIYHNDVDAAYTEFKSSTQTDIGIAASMLERISGRVGFRRTRQIEPVFAAIDSTTRQMREAYFQAYATYKSNVCQNAGILAEATRNTFQLSQRANFVTHELIHAQTEIETATDMETVNVILARIARGLQMGAPETNRRAEQSEDRISGWRPSLEPPATEASQEPPCKDGDK